MKTNAEAKASAFAYQLSSTVKDVKRVDMFGIKYVVNHTELICFNSFLDLQSMT